MKFDYNKNRVVEKETWLMRFARIENCMPAHVVSRREMANDY